MYSAGAASADLFRERGILAMLGFQAGVSYSAEETRKKLVEAWTKADSKIRGSTDELAKNWDGMISMISDKWFQFRNLVMDAGVFDELKKYLSEVNERFGDWIKANDKIIKQKVPEYVKKIKEGLKKIWDVISYDPAIIEWGIVGLAIGGKKGAVLMGSLAHMKTWVENLSKALGLASKGVISFKDIATANFKELEELIEKFENRGKGGGTDARLNAFLDSLTEQEKEITPKTGLGGITTEKIEKTEKKYASFVEKILDWETRKAEKIGELAILEAEYREEGWQKSLEARQEYESKLWEGIQAGYWAEYNLMKDVEAGIKETMDSIDKASKKTFGEEMKNAITGWASSWSRTLTDMVWGAERSFDKILESFGKMITQMIIQKMVVEPILDFSLGSFGLASSSSSGAIKGGKSGIGVRKSEGANLSVNMINESGRPLQAEQKGGPKFDGEKWILDVILKDQQRRGPVTQGFMGMRR